MKTLNSYNKIYKIQPNYGIIRDRDDIRDPELVRRFKDAMLVFRARVELLGSLEHKTTMSEEESLTFMLETLIKGKNKISN